MKIKFLFSLIAVSIMALASCDDSSTEPKDKPIVKIYSELINTPVRTMIQKKADKLFGDKVDSVIVNHARILISEIKLHGDETAEEDSKLVKAGPFVLKCDFDAGKYEITAGTVDAGTYDKIKFEIHRFSPSELSAYASNETFKDFATNERYTVIIDGNLYDGATSEAFTYKGTVTDNLSLSFAAPIELKEDGVYSIYLEFNPVTAFSDGEYSLDPRDSKNANDIDNAVKKAISAVKK